MVILLYCASTLASVQIASYKAMADSTCSSSVWGGYSCHSAVGPVGPISSGVLGGSEYISDIRQCGPRRVRFTDAQFVGDPGCKNYLIWCPLAPGATLDPTKQIVVYQIFDTATKAFLRTDISCDVPTGVSLPSMAAIKAEITKHAPVPTARSGGQNYLVNSAIVFYATPPPGTPSLSDFTVPDFTLAGYNFHVRLHLEQTRWTWGDGHTDNFTAVGTDALGQPYSDRIPCESRTNCSRYISHSYRETGRFTITVEAHWTGTFTINANAQHVPIPGDIYRTDTAGRTITVRQARSILVAPSPP
jgi:hypothetical protein